MRKIREKRHREQSIGIDFEGAKRASDRASERFLKRKALTASTKPQLATGPQKCVVLGPVGESTKALRREAREAPPAREAAIRGDWSFERKKAKKRRAKQENKGKCFFLPFDLDKR